MFAICFRNHVGAPSTNICLHNRDCGGVLVGGGTSQRIARRLKKLRDGEISSRLSQVCRVRRYEILRVLQQVQDRAHDPHTHQRDKQEAFDWQLWAVIPGRQEDPTVSRPE